MKTKYFLPLFLLIQILFLKIIVFFPNWVESFYSNGIFVLISNFSRILLGKIPFSVGDILYAIFILYSIKLILKLRKSLVKDWKSSLIRMLNFISIAHFLFYFLWALNYYRQPLFEKMNIEREYSDNDLFVFTKLMIEKTNEIQFKLTKNKNSKVYFSYTEEQIFKKNLEGYKMLSQEFPIFEYNYPSIKKSIFSYPLTYMGFGGYLNPFTNEAQVNYLMPKYNLPMTSCHEMAHQIGFASESECNFIGFLASVKNDDLYYQYSGYSFALRYCLSNWYAKDPKILEHLLRKVHPGILKNFQETEDFWKQYDSIIDKGFHVFYDYYLKINQQNEGIQSYSKFINLLVNFYKLEEGKK